MEQGDKSKKHSDVEYTPPSERLLGDKFTFNYENDEGYYDPRASEASKKRQRLTTISVHAFIVLIYTIVFAGLWLRASKINAPKHMIFSPLNTVLHPEKHTIDARFGNKNPFKGKPGADVDHAWHELFVNSNVRVTAEELAKINRTSVPINDERGGFYAIPDVYHQLHCLKFLRQVIYKEYYHIEKPTTPIHIDHCIDNLRQNLMCRADVALLTFDWAPNDRAPKPNFKIDHECNNWQMIDDWAKSRAFDIFDERTLVHPTLGPSFPEKEYKSTGKIPGHPGFLHGHGEDVETEEHDKGGEKAATEGGYAK